MTDMKEMGRLISDASTGNDKYAIHVTPEQVAQLIQQDGGVKINPTTGLMSFDPNDPHDMSEEAAAQAGSATSTGSGGSGHSTPNGINQAAGGASVGVDNFMNTVLGWVATQAVTNAGGLTGMVADAIAQDTRNKGGTVADQGMNISVEESDMLNDINNTPGRNNTNVSADASQTGNQTSTPQNDDSTKFGNLMLEFANTMTATSGGGEGGKDQFAGTGMDAPVYTREQTSIMKDMVDLIAGEGSVELAGGSGDDTLPAADPIEEPVDNSGDAKAPKTKPVAGNFMGIYDERHGGWTSGGMQVEGLDPTVNPNDTNIADKTIRKRIGDGQFAVYSVAEAAADAEDTATDTTDTVADTNSADADIPGFGLKGFDFFDFPEMELLDGYDTDITVPGTTGGVKDIFADLSKLMQGEIINPRLKKIEDEEEAA